MLKHGLRFDRTYCESDFSSMRDFFREDAEKVQDTGQRCWVCSKSIDDVCENLLPLRHLYCQIRKTHA
jgi:hypothetical protein